ncbi:MAG TPA: flagellar motor switch protein FliN, partial [Sulfuricurvum sp.]|nr:flagellar motor switch protein FliN [Sulfuricurvum sp.]
MAEAGEINLDAETVPEPGENTADATASDASEGEADTDQQAMIDEWEQMAAETPEVEMPAPEMQPVQGGVDFTTLLDIPLEVTIEVGNASMSIDELLHLTPNSVIELDKFISEPVDIRVNGRLIAQGDLFTEDDSFAIKITA